MSWRLHLSNQSIPYLDILPGKLPLLAAWLRRDRVVYFDLERGTEHSERRFEVPDSENRQGEDWLAFVSGLTAPNDAFLPVVRLDNLSIHTTDDGRMRLYSFNGQDLFLDSNGHEEKLDAADATAFVDVALDRFLGLVCAIDDTGNMHLFQQQIRVGSFALGLDMNTDLRPQVAISRGGGSIFISDGKRLLLTDSSGEVRKSTTLNYYVRRMTCSPNGQYVITCDMDIGVIRVYKGADLVPTHQRFAIDLVAQAVQVQLIADLPPSFVAPSALTIDDDGVIAFSMSGVVCVSNLTQMDELPRPQALL